MELNKDGDWEAWTDAALCLRGDVLFGNGSNGPARSQTRTEGARGRSHAVINMGGCRVLLDG